MVADVFRHAVNRLPHVVTVEDAHRALALPGSCMLAFWGLACWMRDPRNQAEDEAAVLLQSLLGPTPQSPCP